MLSPMAKLLKQVDLILGEEEQPVIDRIDPALEWKPIRGEIDRFVDYLEELFQKGKK